MSEFDAIVVGSGITGGWAAKELCEQGLKVLLLERGRPIDPAVDYTDMQAPWEKKHLDRVSEAEMHRAFSTFERGTPGGYAFYESTKHFWVRDDEQPYETPTDKLYDWIRGYQLGGRSITWGRQSYRWCSQDFENNKRDGHGVDWPIRYEDLVPWYEHVEQFAGISGTKEGLQNLPDSRFQRGFELNHVEQLVKNRIETAFPTRNFIIGRCAHLTEPTQEHLTLGRTRCQARSVCHHGCSFRAYFSSLNATLPAAQKTGNLTTVTHAIVQSLDYDPKSQSISGVRVLDAQTRLGRTYRGRMVFLCASTIPTAMILLSSISESFPRGLANRSDQVGRNLMDHVSPKDAIYGVVPGYLDHYYKGRRPTGPYLPRYGNFTEPNKPYLRGFSFTGDAFRPGLQPDRPGVGEALKTANRTPGPWMLTLWPAGEQLPDPNNRVTLHRTRTDKWGMPIPVIDADWGPNERIMMREASKDAMAMLKSAGCVDIQAGSDALTRPGGRVHEMGTARMGRNPTTSVLNEWNQTHDVRNLFITDGASMASSATQNPSLTYMALTARAAHHAVELLRGHRLEQEV
jgi:choline dehydrogenase-like flavoprotein